MSIIDAHVHLFPPDTNADPARWAATAGELHWATMCVRRRKTGRAVQAFPSVDDLLREMDTAGVERAVLLGWYWETPTTCFVHNRFYAACVRAHPDRLAGFATLNARAGTVATLAEIRRAHADGLVGLGELSPHAQGHSIDDPAFQAALALAAELRWPVNLHVTDPRGAPYPGRVETPLADFTRLARQFPSVNFILAHWGGLLPLHEAVANSAIPKNIFYDTAASPLLYDESVWTRFLGKVPAGQVLFGSDYPLNLYPRTDDVPTMTRFVDEARRAGAGANILRENTARLLKT